MIQLTDFKSARERIRNHILETPVSRHPESNLHFKLENRQVTNAFKPRGALNKILSMQALPATLVTASAGNHGQAVALAAQKTGTKALVFIPQSTPKVKIQRMEKLGAKIERVAGLYGDAEAAAIRAARDLGAAYISPYNDPDVIAGAGTIALEWLEQQPALERILVPVGGGGLVCGVGLAAKALKPGIEIIGVLSEASPYLYHQFYYGHMQGVVEKPTLTDGLAGALEEGSITIGLLPRACDAILQVTEAEIARAIAAFHLQMGETVEGSGAVGLAALLAGKISGRERITGVLASGGNIDPQVLERILADQKAS